MGDSCARGNINDMIIGRTGKRRISCCYLLKLYASTYPLTSLDHLIRHCWFVRSTVLVPAENRRTASGAPFAEIENEVRMKVANDVLVAVIEAFDELELIE